VGKSGWTSVGLLAAPVVSNCPAVPANWGTIGATHKAAPARLRPWL
jgi:hypothetical protein